MDAIDRLAASIRALDEMHLNKIARLETDKAGLLAALENAHETLQSVDDALNGKDVVDAATIIAEAIGGIRAAIESAKKGA